MAGPVFVLQIVLLRWGRKHLLARAVGCGSLPRTAVTVAGRRSRPATGRLPQGHSERGADPRHRIRHPAGQSPPASQRQAEPVRRRPVQSSVHRLTGQPSSAPDHYRWGARFRWSAENRCGRYVVGRAMGVPGVRAVYVPIRGTTYGGAGEGRAGCWCWRTSAPSSGPDYHRIGATLERVQHQQDALQVAVDVFKRADTTGGRITLSTVERRLAELRSHPPGHCPLCPGASSPTSGRERRPR